MRYKLKATNEQDKQRLMDTDSELVVTRGGGWEVDKGKQDQIYSDRRKFNYGWSTHNAIYI